MNDINQGDGSNKENQSVVKDLRSDFSEQVNEELRKVSKKMPLKTKVAILLAIIIVAIGILYFVWDKLFVDKGHNVYTISESTLTDVIETSNLSTLEFTYNAVVTVNTEEEKPKPMYYVAYEGIVTSGIDIENIKVSIVDNTIEISIPNATIQSVDINPGTMEYIFVKEKYNTQNVPSKAYSICKADLEERARKEDDLLKVAKENAKAAINALIEPWVLEVNQNYVVEVK